LRADRLGRLRADRLGRSHVGDQRCEGPFGIGAVAMHGGAAIAATTGVGVDAGIDA
jgi:hypothetical protein